jgi:hypothetical protein
MKYILILFTIFCPVLKANEIIRWETDFYPGFGRVAITYLGQDKVLLEEDRNACAYDNLGNTSICTLMAISQTLDSINLITQGDQSFLYEFYNAKHLRLSKVNGISKILKIDEKTGNVTLAIRLHKNHLTVPDYLIKDQGRL